MAYFYGKCIKMKCAYHVITLVRYYVITLFPLFRIPGFSLPYNTYGYVVVMSIYVTPCEYVK